MQRLADVLASVEDMLDNKEVLLNPVQDEMVLSRESTQSRTELIAGAAEPRIVS